METWTLRWQGPHRTTVRPGSRRLSCCLLFFLRFIFLARERGRRWWRVRRSSPTHLQHSWHLPPALSSRFSTLGAIPRLYGLCLHERLPRAPSLYISWPPIESTTARITEKARNTRQLEAASRRECSADRALGRTWVLRTQCSARRQPRWQRSLQGGARSRPDGCWRSSSGAERLKASRYCRSGGRGTTFLVVKQTGVSLDVSPALAIPSSHHKLRYGDVGAHA
jgi:hypothetical protein